eukprot:c14904_g1_i2.p1 GENE.c14904_g1_i2~~c14904_g1_i2.p1  ORF type:complete len:868 (+),score=194.87 c14904_g1_i2:37-2640(+)
MDEPLVPLPVQGRKSVAHSISETGIFEVFRLSLARKVVVGSYLMVVLLAVIMSWKQFETSVYALVGSTMGGVSSLLVIVKSFRSPLSRVHPNRILFWKSVADLFVAVRLLLNPGLFLVNCSSNEDKNCDDQCPGSSFILQVSLLASETWLFCASLDLFRTLSNPFTNTKKSIWVYHLVVLAIGFGTGAIMIFRKQYGIIFNNQWCWISQSGSQPNIENEGRWVLFFAPMSVMYFTQFCLIVVLFVRMRSGMQTSQEARLLLLVNGSTMVVIAMLYWAAMWVCFVSDFTQTVLFLLAGRGLCNLQAWVIVNEFLEGPTAEGEFGEALAKDIVQFITDGILKSIHSPHEHVVTLPKVTRRVFLRAFFVNLLRGTRVGPLQREERGVVSKPVAFHQYCGTQFQIVRQACSLSEADFEELKEPIKYQISDGGASGSLFFFSHHERYIVKSLTKAELLFWTKRIKGKTRAEMYAEYMVKTRGETRLCRILGIYSAVLYGNNFRFFLMENIFQSKLARDVIHEVYDLKGSTSNRSVKPPQHGKSVRCRHCNRKYTFVDKSHASGRGSMTVPPCKYGPPMHEPSQTLKDNDLTFRIRLLDANQVGKQLEQDVEFLATQFKVMDYSLLIGVHKHHVDSVESPSSAFRAENVYGPNHFYLGIIDYLQTWDTNKRLERFWKVWVLRKASRAVSAAPVDLYKHRFLEMLGDVTNCIPPPRVFLSLFVNGRQVVSITLVLDKNLAPRTVRNFIELINDHKAGYLNTHAHDITRTAIEFGHLPKGNRSIFGKYFQAESFELHHDRPGLLSMVDVGGHTNDSRFLLTLDKAPELDGKNVVFGSVIPEHMGFVQVIRDLQQDGAVATSFIIGDCGERDKFEA